VAWNDKNKAIWRRIDHSNISILIAGTYTPFATYLLEPNQAQILLILAWSGALISSLLRIFWLTAPRWLYVGGYIALGWAAVIYLPELLQQGGVAILVLVISGGLCYSVGGIIYALKKPNFSINWFGFHELFHVLTAAGFICHFVAGALTVFLKS
jgi:hemolysin III